MGHGRAFLPLAPSSPMKPPTIKAEIRDVLYERILVRLSGISDVEIAIENGDFKTASRLSLEFSDYLRLLHDDLGWGDRSKGVIELRSPTDVLRRSFNLLKERAEIEDRLEEEERVEARQLHEQHQLVQGACDEVLAGLLG